LNRSLPSGTTSVIFILYNPLATPDSTGVTVFFVALNAFYWYILLLDNSLDENETTDIQDAFRDQYKFPKRIEANNNTTNILVSPIDCMQAEESQSALTMDQWLRYKNKNDME